MSWLLFVVVRSSSAFGVSGLSIGSRNPAAPTPLKNRRDRRVPWVWRYLSIKTMTAMKRRTKNPKREGGPLSRFVAYDPVPSVSMKVDPIEDDCSGSHTQSCAQLQYTTGEQDLSVDYLSVPDSWSRTKRQQHSAHKAWKLSL